MSRHEVIARIRGGGMVAVVDLIRTKQLRFDVVETRHHGANLHQTALKILAVYPHFRDALVYATGNRCKIRFRHGTAVSIDTDGRIILVGIDCDPDEATRLIAGAELQQTPARRIDWWLFRLNALFKKIHRHPVYRKS